MAIKILIRRSVSSEKAQMLAPLMKKLRALALEQPGYISGETLRNIDQPGTYVVLSTWKDLVCWNAWLKSPERIEIQAQIDALTGNSTQYEVFSNS